MPVALKECHLLITIDIENQINCQCTLSNPNDPGARGEMACFRSGLQLSTKG